MSGSHHPADVWASGAAYEPYVGHWSRLVAREFLRWLGASPGGHWLDVGCGTGALTAAIGAVASPANVVGVDPSEAYVAYARGNVSNRRVTFSVGDATRPPLRPDGYDAVVSGLVLNFLPDPAAGVAAMTGATRADGRVAAYVWDYAGRMDLMRRFWDAAVALDPAAGPLDEGRRFPLCHPEPLAALFHGAGLVDVATTAIDVATPFDDFDDYWRPFLGGQAPAPAYAMSLTEERRAALRERLRATLPIRPDGHIDLLARAWAVRGTKA